jgi:type VI secretion system protein ImpL
VAVWWILSGLLVLIVWALEFIFSYPLWIACLATAILVTLVVAIAIVGRIQAARSAAALERAIAAQAAQHALNARPERRAEIQALQRQISDGIGALKSSKLGHRRGGVSALYSLPWYMIVGPPGAGKTTALKHSGLAFPYQGAGGDGGVRGVGGTRNCDWWFTNEGILLDTAGRYATEAEDRDEWLAFLAMLRRYRSRQPINGVLIAISVAEIIDANEQQLEATGKKLRARIDEVMTQLRMVVPVYVLFTKCDLIAGFNEFFGDMRKTDRAQVWGATLKLSQPKNDPSKIFDAEFDLLRQQVHARALKRLATERNRESREKIYQFPLELAGAKRNLSELIGITFAVNSFQGTPIFRGFYFTSGTQEGRPLDRVLGRMGQAMGLRLPETSIQKVVESKSYFLHDVFMNVVFPDGSIAARSAGEIRRQRILRVAVSGSAAALGLVVALRGVSSYANNRDFIHDTQTLVNEVSAIVWADAAPPGAKVDKLKPLLDRLEQLDDYHRSTPMRFSWMYQGDTLSDAAIAVYVKSLQQGFVTPVKLKLEARLKAVKGEHYLQERTLLRVYLMLSDVDHLDVNEPAYRSCDQGDGEREEKKKRLDGTEVGALTALWAEILRPTSNIPESELNAKLRPHVRHYLRLLKSNRVKPLPANDKLVADARRTLQNVPVAKRYYDLFVSSLIDQKYDEGGEDVRSNRKYPSLALNEMFVDRPDVLKWITSTSFEKEKRYKEVDGPYTEKGHYKVLKNVAEGAGLLEREQWVVPLTAAEQGEQVVVNLRRLAETYDQRYIDEWTDWLTDISVRSPASIKEALDLYATLTRPEWPYLRILRNLYDHTQWKKDSSLLENEEVKREAARRVQQQAAPMTRGIQVNIDLRQVAGRTSLVPATFKRATEFAVPVPGQGSETPLALYESRLDALRGDLVRLEDTTPNPDPRLVNDRLDEALKAAQTLLQSFDDKAKGLLAPLLSPPLRLVPSKLPPGGVGSPSVRPPGRWQRPSFKP